MWGKVSLAARYPKLFACIRPFRAEAQETDVSYHGHGPPNNGWLLAARWRLSVGMRVQRKSCKNEAATCGPLAVSAPAARLSPAARPSPLPRRPCPRHPVPTHTAQSPKTAAARTLGIVAAQAAVVVRQRIAWRAGRAMRH